MRRLFSLVLAICLSPAQAADDDGWRTELARFRLARRESIAGPDGWATLVARAPLANGTVTVGRSDAGIVLDTPNAPALLGTLTVDGGALRFEAAPSVDVRLSGRPVTTTTLSDDAAGAATVLEVGSLKAHVIKRKDQRFLRVKDREHPARQRFDTLSWFEPAPAWRVRGTFEAADAGVFIEVTNVLGQVEPQPVRGTVAFRLDGGTQRLVALDGTDGGLFLIFKDATAGRSTYGAGRFLDTPAPAADGRVEVDFNRAVNPPCAFTAFATCPLPPRANVLKVAIEAGERAPAGGHPESTEVPCESAAARP